MTFEGWDIYREKSILAGIAIGIFSILFGGVFAFLYLLICAIRTKGDLQLFFNGKTAIN
jgi:Na+-transporting methylmalonyl-CoA/oxaloacetate decarboxylase gamma subunit